MTESDNESDVENDWMLGFVEAPLRNTDLLRHQFPSKVGGRPAWLDPINLPSHDELCCEKTGKLMRFLLQVYAPVDENQEAFHRSLFVFISSEGPAVHGSPDGVKAFRCQLPRENAFYGYDPAAADDMYPRITEECPIDPWKVQQAEQQGSSNAATLSEDILLFPEFELVVEPEPSDVSKVPEEIQKYTDLGQQYTEEEMPGEVVDTLEKSLTEEQRHFAEFATRTSVEPSQVLRYCFEDCVQPICPSPLGIPRGEDIPVCPYCHGPRKFEFQIMPQLLNNLNVDPSDSNAPDWGTIAIYSCAASCAVSSRSYVKEYVWVQPPV